REGEHRYRLLETVRRYGLDRLREAGEVADVHRRHLAWFLALAEQAEAALRGQGQQRWLQRLDLEYDNLRVALEWGKTDKEASESGLRLAWALWHYWDVRAYLSEGREWLEAMLARGTAAPPALRARALNGAGVLAYRQGDYERVAALCGEALALCEEHRDDWGRALALHYLAHVEQSRGDHSRAAELMAHSVEVYQRIGDRWGTALSMNCLGDVARSQADYAKARDLLEGALALFRELGDRWGMAMSLHNLGYASQRLGDQGRAAVLFEESLGLGRELGIKEILIMCLAGLAGASAAHLAPQRAATLLGTADALLAAAGASFEPADREDFDRNVALVRARLGDEAFSAAWNEGRAMTLDRALDYALRERRQP
ncbi:MAG: tetratricopeptide repeat protein, partial [Armatimonadetes bacterium]|nr:tetratricopeptide repeat protein [Armatimonadota bacterium]